MSTKVGKIPAKKLSQRLLLGEQLWLFPRVFAPQSYSDRHLEGLIILYSCNYVLSRVVTTIPESSPDRCHQAEQWTLNPERGCRRIGRRLERLSYNHFLQEILRQTICAYFPLLSQRIQCLEKRFGLEEQVFVRSI